MEVGPFPNTRWHGSNITPTLPRPTRILGKGWGDRAQDNPKIYGQSEIYWNWTTLSSSPLRATEAQENPDFCKKYRAGTLTVGKKTTGGDADTFSWRDNLIRPLAGAPIRFQTIPFLYESTERAYNSTSVTQAAELQDLSLYKNGYFHSLVSDPVLYRYRAGSMYGANPEYVYDDSCKDSQQSWLPHHKGNITLQAVDPDFNWINSVPKEPLRTQSHQLYCPSSVGFAGPWCSDWNMSVNGKHQYWAPDKNGDLVPACYSTSSNECATEPGASACPPCVGWNGAGGYVKGATVSYNGCCWVSPGMGVQGYNSKGESNRPLPSDQKNSTDHTPYDPLPPGTEFEADGKTTLWKISSCSSANGGTSCNVGKITFDRNFQVSSASSPGSAYKGSWSEKTTYMAGEIVFHQDVVSIESSYYKCRRDYNTNHEPVITTDYDKPVNYQSLTTLTADSEEVESRYEKNVIDNWWQLSPEPMQAEVTVSLNKDTTPSTIAVKAGYDVCDPCISGFDPTESYGPDEDIQVVRYAGKVWKATGNYYDSAAYTKPGETAGKWVKPMFGQNIHRNSAS